MSRFISYSGGAPDFAALTKKPQSAFVWWKTLVTVYGVRPTFAYPEYKSMTPGKLQDTIN